VISTVFGTWQDQPRQERYNKDIRCYYYYNMLLPFNGHFYAALRARSKQDVVYSYRRHT